MTQLRKQHLLTLEFEESSTPTFEEIKKAFRKLSHRYHPDSIHPQAQRDVDKFKQVTEAYRFFEAEQNESANLEEQDQVPRHEKRESQSPLDIFMPFLFAFYMDGMMQDLRDAQEKVRKAQKKEQRRAQEKALREADERARREEERARREAEERARREAEERARREADERARREEERARREAEERARREAEERARREAEERARREAEERARREAEERVRREAEERVRREAEEKARRGPEQLDSETVASRNTEVNTKTQSVNKRPQTNFFSDEQRFKRLLKDGIISNDLNAIKELYQNGLVHINSDIFKVLAPIQELTWSERPKRDKFLNKYEEISIFSNLNIKKRQA